MAEPFSPSYFGKVQASPYEKQLLHLIGRERAAWEWAQVWVSDDAFYSMRTEIDTGRKNYYGQFEDTEDSQTGLKKLFYPLTEKVVERTVSNIDLDTKDIHISSPEAGKRRVATLMKLIVRQYLKMMNFGEFLNDFLRRLTIDGTAVAKVFNKYSQEFKRNIPQLRIVDPLNLIIDPSAYSIQEVPILERSEMTIDEIERKTDWKKKDLIDYSKGSVPTATIYERWGKIPTRKGDKWIEGCVVCSAMQNEAGEEEIAIVHKIIENPKGVKPYEECWLRRVPNRWHGRGIPEMLKNLQTWLNTIINVRRDDMLNRLAGKYKIKKGSGITRQMLESIRAGGAIPVDNMDDIQELAESDVKMSSYEEQASVINIAEGVAMAKEIPSQPALEPTTAVIQERQQRSPAMLIQENIGLFLERLLRRHLIPLILKDLQNGEISRITGEMEDLETIDEYYTNRKVLDFVLQMVNAEGKTPDPSEAEIIKLLAGTELKKLGKDRYIKILKYVFDVNYDVDVQVTAERLDTAVMLRDMNDFLISYGRLPNADINVINSIVQEYLNALNISPLRNIEVAGQPAAARAAGQPVRPRREVSTPQAEFERAAIEGTLSPREK